MSSLKQSTSDSTERREKKKCRRAKVVYSYTPMNDDELELEVNDIIEILDEVEEGWCMGLLKGKRGVFPSNFVVDHSPEEKDQLGSFPTSNALDNEDSASPGHEDEVKPKPVKGMGFGNIFQSGAIKLKSTNEQISDHKGITLISPTGAEADDAPKLPPKPAREQARVLFSYDAQNEDELNLAEGSIVTVLAKEVEDVGWWKGEINGKIGVFPDNFVELISVPEPSLTKPNRPDLPVSALPTKSNKPASNVPKSQESIKTKDIESKSPIPPASCKKPQLPSPLKKPQRSPKPLASTPPTSKKSPAQKPSDMANNNGIPELLTDDMKAKSQDKSTNDFGMPQVSEEKLTHLTANRARAPNRRPPSQFIMKDTEQENGIETESNQPNWMKELKKTQKAKRSSQLSSDVESSIHVKEPAHVEKPPKPSPPSKPFPSQTVKDQSKDEIKQKSVPSNPANASPQKLPVNVKQEQEIELPVKSIEKEPSPMPQEVLPSAVKSIIFELQQEIKDLRASSVSKSEFLEMKEQYSLLKEAHEKQQVKFNKKLLELMNELDEEKKIRMSMKVEVDRVKKLAMA